MYNADKKVLLSIRRFKQKPSECAIAAAASLANFYDPSVTYRQVRKMVLPEERPNGLYTWEESGLLNDLGFKKITIVTANEGLFDFSWRDVPKDQLLKKLRRKRDYVRRRGDKSSHRCLDSLIRWLDQTDCDNNLIIDYDFPKYIRHHLDHGRPVGASFNWTKIWRMPKTASRGHGDIAGEPEEHAIVIRGYDNKGVFVVDSHTQWYRGRLRRYRNGYYKISWSKYLVNAPDGDLILIH